MRDVGRAGELLRRAGLSFLTGHKKETAAHGSPTDPIGSRSPY